MLRYAEYNVACPVQPLDGLVFMSWELIVRVLSLCLVKAILE
jgi:hypothetical protein